MIRFPCPTCENEVQVDDAFAGQTLRCPRCRHGMTVPAPAVTAEPSRRREPTEDYREDPLAFASAGASSAALIVGYIATRVPAISAGTPAAFAAILGVAGMVIGGYVLVSKNTLSHIAVAGVAIGGIAVLGLWSMLK